MERKKSFTLAFECRGINGTTADVVLYTLDDDCNKKAIFNDAMEIGSERQYLTIAMRALVNYLNIGDFSGLNEYERNIVKYDSSKETLGLEPSSLRVFGDQRVRLDLSICKMALTT